MVKESYAEEYLMRLSPIILKLRLKGIKPFNQQVAGIADFAQATTSTLLSDTAFVVQLTESAAPNTYDNGINHKSTMCLWWA